ncbi:MAG TPA: hypothetical protein VFD06_14955 [Candidatus Polarisedimenticolia bacterium]|nr:hypothetical protein [Candidatus Polarisedimenticolia bacterium]
MKTIREVGDRPLRWTRPRMLERQYELVSGTDVVGGLRWESMFGSLATAETADGTWTFKRAGFVSPRVTVRTLGSDTDLAVLRVGFKGDGLLHGPDRQTYQWQRTSFWRSEWAFATETGRLLVGFDPDFSLLKHAATVKLEPEALQNPDLSLLVTLGWYLMLLLSEEVAGVTASTAAAAAAAG